MSAFLRIPDVKKKTGLSRTTIYDRIKKNTFPKPIKLSKTISVWLESEIDDWIDDFVAEQRGQVKEAA